MGDSSSENEVVFGAFDPTSEVERTSRNLPHWFQPGVAVFVTFRTLDSMPKEVIQRWQQEQEEWLTRQGLDTAVATDKTQLAHLSVPLQREFRRMRDRLWHRSLDDCHGDCVLRQPALARIVGDSLLYFNEDRYDLDSYIVMPNHVHLIVQFRSPATLSIQTQSWLRYTARRINEHLGRRGSFWQCEPFDHLIRSPEQFFYLRKYLAENPMKANLREGEYLYWTRVLV